MNNSLHTKTTTAPVCWRTQAFRALAVCALLLVPSLSEAGVGQRQTLQHTVPAAAASATKVGQALSVEKLNLSISLALRDPEGLTNFLADVYNPASPNFRHFLTPEEFADRFGPSKEDYAAVVKFAHDNGLTVTGQFPNRLVVSVKGTVGVIEKALNVSLNNYKHPTEGRNFYAPDREPTLDLAVPIASIAGLDNFALPKTHFHMVTNAAPSQLKTGSGATADGIVKSGNGAVPQTGTGPSGAYYGKDLRAAYMPGVTLTGTGQSIGLLEFDTTVYTADITTFMTATGAPNVPINTEFIDGAVGQGSANANEECSLDVEMAIGMCPGLTQVVIYDGNGTGDDIYTRMVSDNSCKQISSSWTFTTDAGTTTLLMEMAAQGQSYFNASGDSDAYVGAPPTPTDSQYVTTVGGTVLTTSSAGGPWSSEIVWNYPNSNQAGQGTGGGISTTVPIPIWQQSVSMANNQGSTTFRNVPDVAMCADNIYVYADNGAGNGSYVGTSCATPLWAGVAAMANQLALSVGEPTVGLLNPTIYGFGLGSNALSYSTLFHDITSGNNEWPSSPTKYVAVTGYDLCTGWGSPTGLSFITALAEPEALKVSPFANEVFAGGVGGPFVPASQSYVLTNSGTAPLNWALSSLPSWLDAFPTSGTLTPGGGSTSVVLSIDPSATNMAAGSYTTPILFTNITDGFAQTLMVTLAVEVSPVITTQPTNYAALLGSTASFSVGIAPNALVAYQWRTNGVALTNSATVTGVTTSTLVITSVSSNNVGNYTVSVTNVVGATNSSIAALSIIQSAPVIASSPTNVTVLPGGKTTLSVVAYGNPTFAYHWYTNGSSTPLANVSGKILNATTASLTITNISTATAGNYYCIVSNTLGAATSAVAQVTLAPVTIGAFALNANASFSATSTQPQNPYSAPVYVPSQSAYFGTTYNGGSSGGGGTWKVTTAAPTTVTREGNLSYTTQGAGPIGTPCLAANGDLYMTAVILDTDNEGTLFQEVPSSTTLTVEVQFNGDNGGEPVGGIMQASDGGLYGSGNVGGVYGAGTLFKYLAGTTTLTNLISFDIFNGQFPSPVLVQGPDGYLYGTAENGGSYDSSAGTIYKISTNGTFVLLHSFNGTNDGAVPIAGLTLGVDGNFYGTTLLGGAENFGTVYQMTPGGVVTTLYSFTNGADGAEPWAGLVQAPDGNFYGAAQQGGLYGDGTIFQISPTGNFAAVAQFDGFQGALPEANLIVGPDGNLYGTCYNGGVNGTGVFYQFVVTNASPIAITGQPVGVTAYTGVNAVFAVATSGGPATSYLWQSNGVNLANGNGFSGATSAVLTVSNITTSSPTNYNVIVTSAANTVTSTVAALNVLMTGPTITTQPVSQTIVAGGAAVFTVAATGDAPLSYQWQANGTNLSDGATVSGSTKSLLIVSNLSLASSGTAYSVIVSNPVTAVTSSNAVVTVVPANLSSVTFTTLHTFTGASTDGNAPAAALMQGLDGNLYGTASGGGTSFGGTIFKMTLAGTMTTLVNFGANGYVGITSTTNGAFPQGALAQVHSTGLMYGVTQAGGNNDDGVFFRVATNGTTAPALTQFTGSGDSAGADCTLCLASDGNLYGTSTTGGTGSIGSIYKLATNGTVTLLYSFTGGTDGSDPIAGLVQGPDGYLYGVNVDGGSGGVGTAFKVSTSGVLTPLVQFSRATNGAEPFGGLLFGQDGNLYGTTAQGGANNYGTVFKMTTNGALTTLFSFSGTNGGFPGASLIQAPDGSLYGTTEGNSTTSGGGIGGQGTVFRITTNGVLTTLFWFDGYNGGQPEGALVLASNGALYGTATTGGATYNPTTYGGWGTVFEIILPVLTPGPFTATNAVEPLPYSGVLLGTATPPAGDTYTYSLVSGPSWLSVAANGALSGTPTSTNIGTNTFVIGVADANGFYGSTNLNLVVIADPAPIFTSNPFTEASVNADTNYTASISSSATALYAADGDIVTYALVSGPAWLSITTNGILSGMPADSDGGTNMFVVSATDLGGSSNVATLDIYVNVHPTFVSPTNILMSAVAGGAYSGTLVPDVTDPPLADGDTLTFSVLSGPAWLSVATNGALSGTPSMTDEGTNLFQVEALDSDGLSATAYVEITVNPPTPPVITVPSTIVQQITNVVGNVVVFTVTATDTVDGAISPMVTPASGSTFPYGTTVVTATATASYGLSATNTFLVTIQDTNLPVIVTEPTNLTVYEGTSNAFSVVATSLSPLTYQWLLGTNAIMGATNSTLTFASVDYTNAGTYEVEVSNGGGTSNSVPVTLTVVAPAPPVVTVPSTITVQITNIAGNAVFFTVTATDTVDGVIVPYVTPASGSVFPLGTNLVTAVATNSIDLAATNEFLVVVEDTNPPVIVTEPMSETNDAGTTASFSVVATALSPLTYQWSFGTNVLMGQTNSTLTVPSVGPANVGAYEVAVSDEGATTNSTAAFLTVVYVPPTVLGGSQTSYGTNGFSFTFSGPAGQTYEVLGSSDPSVPLSTWTVLATGTFTGTNMVFTDTNSLTNPFQFYSVESP